MDGVLIIDKPSGPTSFDVVRAVRKRMNRRRVGHAGTLDPLASGLLAVCIGQGTKLVPYLMDSDKEYRVRVALGQETDTLDADGAVVCTAEVPPVDEEILRPVLERFKGRISQVPPQFSALKKDGEALYKKARRGETVAPTPRDVVIHAIDIEGIGSNDIALTVRCGKGTYIRSLARDIARALGTVGHVATLRRTAASGFRVEDALSFDALKDPGTDIVPHLRSLAEGIPHLPRLTLDDEKKRAVLNGRPVPVPEEMGADPIEEDRPVALLAPEQILVCIAERRGPELKPLRVFPH